MNGSRVNAAIGARRLATDASAEGRARRRIPMVPMRKGRIMATMLAFGLATATVMFGSYAAWTDQTTNPGNSVTAGALDITNDKDAAAVFAVTGVSPGDTGTDTVVISDAGTVDFQLFLTQSNISASVGNIEANLRLSVHDDTRNYCYYPVAGAGACGAPGAWDGTGTMTNLQIMNSAGGALWDASTDESHTFTLGWELVAASDADDMGETGSFDLTWDATQ